MSDGSEQIHKMYKRQLDARIGIQTRLFLNDSISLDTYLATINNLKESYKEEKHNE